MTWCIQPLESGLERSRFDCGDVDLNAFIRQYARQQQVRNYNRTYVALDGTGKQVIGYYSISAGSIAFAELRESDSLPKYPVPVVRIGRLAVDSSVQGKGLGQQLLANALKLSVTLADQVGIHAVVVDAKHRCASQYYQRLGFIPCKDAPLTLYLPTATIKQGMA